MKFEKMRPQTEEEIVKRERSIDSIAGGFLIPIEIETGFYLPGRRSSEDEPAFFINEKNATPELIDYAYNKGKISLEKNDQIKSWLLEKTKNELEQTRNELEQTRKELVTDKLTQTPNFSAFGQTLQFSIEELEQRKIEALVLIALDLNKFKEINDTHGHNTGDKALIAFAERMRVVLREEDQFAFRKGGDEFAIILKIKKGDDSSEERIKAIFQVIKKKINNELFITKTLEDGTEENITIESAMGYAVMKSGDNKTSEVLFAEADAEAAKDKGNKGR